MHKKNAPGAPKKTTATAQRQTGHATSKSKEVAKANLLIAELRKKLAESRANAAEAQAKGFLTYLILFFIFHHTHLL